MCWFKLCNVSENTAHDFSRHWVRPTLGYSIYLSIMHLLFSASSELRFGALPASPTENFCGHWYLRWPQSLLYFLAVLCLNNVSFNCVWDEGRGKLRDWLSGLMVNVLWFGTRRGVKFNSLLQIRRMDLNLNLQWLILGTWTQGFISPFSLLVLLWSSQENLQIYMLWMA